LKKADVQPATSPIALERIRGVRHQLQFAQHELGSHNGSIEKSGFRNVRDTSVNNHAGIENLVTFLVLPLAADVQELRLNNGQAEACLCRQDRCEFPTAEQKIHCVAR